MLVSYSHTIICMILQDVDDKYDKKNTLPFLANCKTRSLFWHLKNMADRGYGLDCGADRSGDPLSNLGLMARVLSQDLAAPSFHAVSAWNPYCVLQSFGLRQIIRIPFIELWPRLHWPTLLTTNMPKFTSMSCTRLIRYSDRTVHSYLEDSIAIETSSTSFWFGEIKRPDWDKKLRNFSCKIASFHDAKAWQRAMAATTGISQRPH